MLPIRVINFYDEEGDLTRFNVCVADKGDQLLQGRGPNPTCVLQIREINFYKEGDLTRFNLCVADKGDQLLR